MATLGGDGTVDPTMTDPYALLGTYGVEMPADDPQDPIYTPQSIDDIL